MITVDWQHLRVGLTALIKSHKYTLSWLRQHFSDKTLCVSSALLVLWFFGDHLIPAILHLLHLKLEVIEFLLEHALESLFDLSPREAQVVLFWLFMGVSGVVAWRVSKKLYRSTLKTCQSAYHRWQDKVLLEKINAASRSILLAVLVGKLLFIFS